MNKGKSVGTFIIFLALGVGLFSYSIIIWISFLTSNLGTSSAAGGVIYIPIDYKKWENSLGENRFIFFTKD